MGFTKCLIPARSGGKEIIPPDGLQLIGCAISGRPLAAIL